MTVTLQVAVIYFEGKLSCKIAISSSYNLTYNFAIP